MTSVLRALIADDRGVALPEYALTLALFSVAALLALAGVAVAASAAFTNSSAAMQTYTIGTPPP
jgi:Flp pilus assembly pilin Flp